jgi:cobyrinic acid a,c-diamide synthase
MLYPRMKKMVEEELGIGVYGYVPVVEECRIESRHLGLVLPDEVEDLKGRLCALAKILEDTLDLDGILALAAQAAPVADSDCSYGLKGPFDYHTERPVRIGVAEDDAFCFFYRDNFRLLTQMGAELVSFSPLSDPHLPENLDGLLLYGGYPELHGAELEANESMRSEIRAAIENGMPCLAECGGFMYLHEQMEDIDGVLRTTAGVIPGKAFRTKRLTRFGYVTLRMAEGTGAVLGEKDLGEIPAHEFHYYDSENNGDAFLASKPLSSRSWKCIHAGSRVMAGFPHLHYYGNPSVPKAFLKTCLNYQEEKMQRSNS